MPFLIAFTIFALLDFTVLFSVGSQIGLLPTIGLVLATGFIGLHLIRKEGVATFARAQERMSRGEIPSSELLTGAALIFGGALLMAPGFLSDALGFICLIPNARRLLGKLLAKIGIRTQGFHVGGSFNGHTGTSSNWDDTVNQRNHTADSEYTEQQDAQHQHSQQSSDRTSDEPLEGEFIGKNERRY
ncbi:FxsA family protein [Halomonas binhaiensis]|uniref:FxsA family protein n=1 Tax=Halomonas binhaiensis TaxID=2562282 RepID=A0A5C1NIW0_9GAMM|nr:FxsA family protein [Halomonas binhaiensis]QEM82197.1 FxsA family protein [Halomonas binhaiensis]